MPDRSRVVHDRSASEAERRPRRAPRTHLLASAVIGLIALCLTASARAHAADNIIANPNLTDGAGAAPDGWTSEGWIAGTDATTYNWVHGTGGGGQLEISSTRGNDARWVQKLHIAPGWYYFSADIRSADVGDNNTGASIGLMEDGIIS